MDTERVEETRKELCQLECCQMLGERGLVTKGSSQKVRIPVEGD